MSNIVVGKILENQKIGAVQNLQNGQYALLKKNNGQISCIQSASVTNSNLNNSSVSAVVVGPSTSYSNTGSTPSFKRLEIKNASNSALTSVPSSVSALTVSLTTFSINASNRGSLSSVCVFNASINSIASKLIGQLDYTLSSTGLSVYDMHGNCSIFGKTASQDAEYETIRDFNDNLVTIMADDVNLSITIDDDSAAQTPSYSDAVINALNTGYLEIETKNQQNVYVTSLQRSASTYIFDGPINFSSSHSNSFSGEFKTFYFKQNTIDDLIQYVSYLGIGLDLYGYPSTVVCYCSDGIVVVSMNGGSSGSGGGGSGPTTGIENWSGLAVLGFNSGKCERKVTCSLDEASQIYGMNLVDQIARVIAYDKNYNGSAYQSQQFVFGADLFSAGLDDVYGLYRSNEGSSFNVTDLAEIHINATQIDSNVSFEVEEYDNRCSIYYFHNMTVSGFLSGVDAGYISGIGVVYSSQSGGTYRYPVICYCKDGVVLFNADSGSSSY